MSEFIYRVVRRDNNEPIRRSYSSKRQNVYLNPSTAKGAATRQSQSYAVGFKVQKAEVVWEDL